MSSVTLDSGLTLSYSGKGARSSPTVVLLPGPTDSWRSYQPVLERLPPAVHTIAVSQRGHGESDKPENGYRIEDFATDVVGLLDALAIERAVLAGHSGSCFVARRVALDYPERVAGLLLEASPGTLRHDARLVDFVESVVSNLSDPISPEFARQFIAETSAENVPPDLSDVLVTELLKVPARVWKQMFADLLRYEDVDQLADIKAPTLLIWGDADQLVNRETQDPSHGRSPPPISLSTRPQDTPRAGKTQCASAATLPPSRCVQRARQSESGDIRYRWPRPRGCCRARYLA